MILLFLIYSLLLIAAAVIGGALAFSVRLDHRRSQLVLSLVAGVMLGVAFLHLMPHALVELDDLQWAFGAALAGLLFMFFMIRIFNFHQHEPPCPTEPCEDDHHHHDAHRDVSWSGLAFGLSVHTLIDGLALAAAFKAELRQEFWLPGIGIFLAILLHKPLDALFIASLMEARQVHRKKTWAAILIFALICPLGAALAFSGIMQTSGDFQHWLLGVALGFSAGVFVCISLADLLPEVQFHSHDRLALSGMLILGIAVAVAITFLPRG